MAHSAIDDPDRLVAWLGERLPATSRLALADFEAGPGRVACTIAVPADACWFAGHFPGEPVLPGVAQVHLAGLIALATLVPGGRARSGARLKFRRRVVPGESLRLETAMRRAGAGNASGNGAGDEVRDGACVRVAFEWTCGGEAVSSGQLVFDD